MSPQHQTFEFSADSHPAYESSLGGLRERVPRLAVIVASGSLSVSGTSSAEPTRVWGEPYVHDAESTTSGPDGQVLEATEQSAEMTRRAISDLRRISGLTWEQLGQLFEVSRRSVHFWASGKPLNAANEQRLLRVLDIVRDADRQDARRTRTALFEATDGIAAFDLLVSQRFDEAHARLGRGPGRRELTRAELSATAKAARKPLSPEELADAMQERIHRDVGRGRAARTARNKPRGRD